MKINFAKILCFNAVLFLLGGILFASTNTLLKKEKIKKEFHFVTKTETSFVLLSFMEEEDDDETGSEFISVFESQNLYSYSNIYSYFVQNKFNHKYHLNSTQKVPRWIKMRHIIL